MAEACFWFRKNNLLLTKIATERASAFWCHFSQPQFLKRDVKRASWHMHMQRIELPEKDLKLKETQSFIMGSKPAWSLPRKVSLSLLSCTVNLLFPMEGDTISHYANIFQQLVLKKVLVPLLRNLQRHGRPWRAAPHQVLLLIRFSPRVYKSQRGG